jgi:fermentation-respiration switch protein FrsA (DUF1100 family)
MVHASSHPAEVDRGRKKRYRWRSRLIAVAGLYLIWVGMSLFGPLTSLFVLIPTTHPIRMPGIRSEMIATPVGPIEIWRGRDTNRDRGWDDVEPEAYLLEFTGNGTRAEEIADDAAVKFRPHSVEVWAMNFPGYGNSAGPARLARIPPAALAVYDELKKRAGEKPIFVAGNSLGTSAALYVAANRPVAGVVLTNPPPLRQLIRGNFGWWNLWLLSTPASLGVPRDLDSIANARKCAVPAVILTSTRDEVVPFKYQQMVADAYAGPKAVKSRNATHNESFEGNDSEWLRTQIQAMFAGPAKR